MLNRCCKQIDAQNINHEPKVPSEKLHDYHLSEVSVLMRFTWKELYASKSIDRKLIN